MSRQGLPVRTTHNTASTKRRLFSPLRPGSPGLPRQCASICAHWASVSTSRSIVSLNHTLTRANNPDSQQALEDKYIFFIVTNLSPEKYAELNLLGQWLELPEVIGLHYQDQIDQSA